MKNSFAEYSNLGCQLFFFSIWNMSFNSLLVYKVSAEKSAVSLKGISLNVTSVLISQILSFFFVLLFDYNML
jgi:hypothetical protein